MNQLNPNALNLWIFSTTLGYLIGGTRGSVLGLAISSGITLILSLTLNKT